MKTTQSSAMQFSEYPLRTVEDNVPYPQISHLKIVKEQEKHSRSTQVSNAKANDPSSWDIDWFCNYE